jgi:hypothetical protein
MMPFGPWRILARVLGGACGRPQAYSPMARSLV